MRPDRRPSQWVKVRPWYYTERRIPPRADVNREAIIEDQKADEDDRP